MKITFENEPNKKWGLKSNNGSISNTKPMKISTISTGNMYRGKQQGNQQQWSGNRNNQQNFQQNNNQQWKQQQNRNQNQQNRNQNQQNRNQQQQQQVGQNSTWRTGGGGNANTGAQDVPAKLTVRNLDVRVTMADIFTLFKEFGEITESAIHYDANGKPSGSAHVTFKRYGDAMRGLRKYNRVTLDNRPMVISVEKLAVQGSQKVTTPVVKTATTIQTNNQVGMTKKQVKRLQQGPQNVANQSFQRNQQSMNTVQKVMNTQQQQIFSELVKILDQPLMGNRPQQSLMGNMSGQSLMGNAPQQSLMGNMPQQNRNRQPLMGNVPQQQSLMGNRPQQMSFGVSNQFNNAVMNNMQQGTTASFVAMNRTSVLGRLGDKTDSGSASVLSRLDGGLVTPVRPNIKTRLSGVSNSAKTGNAPKAKAVNMNTAANVKNRVGAVQTKAAAQKSLKQGMIVPAMPAMGAGQQWSFALPVGVPVTPKGAQQARKVNQPQQQQKKKGNQPQPQPQKKKGNQPQPQPQKKVKFQKKPTPTAAELDAELDEYLSKMTK